jgi:hypothetical protein
MLDGFTTTDTTGATVTTTDTVADAVAAENPVLPDADAVTVIVALPGATAVTRPVPDTVATLGTVVPYVTLAAGAPLGCDTEGVSPCVCPTVRLAALGDTLIPVMAAGSAETVTVAVPCTPSTVAVTVALPTATAVTSPAVLTVATAAFDVDHETARPVRLAPDPSRADADSCCVPPTNKLAVRGDTRTLLTNAETDTVEDPVTPSTVAEISAVPAAIAVTVPLAETVATAGAEELQVTGRSVSTPPEASRTTALMACVCPTANRGASGETVTEAAALRTVSTTCALFPSDSAASAVVPGPTAVTTPDELTVATALFPVLHATGRPVRMAFAALRRVAVNWRRSPVVRVVFP